MKTFCLSVVLSFLSIISVAQNSSLCDTVLKDSKNYLDSVSNPYMPKKLIIKSFSCIYPPFHLYTYPDSLLKRKIEILSSSPEWPQKGNIEMPSYTRKTINSKGKGKKFDACIITPVLYKNLVFTGFAYKHKKEMGGYVVCILYSTDYNILSIKITSISHIEYL